jgi:quinol-cytochrome oxidoreductase complex cytochrome b subunit
MKPSLGERVRNTPVGGSVFRIPARRTRRERAGTHWASFFLHIYPVKVRREELSFRYSWFLGVISLILFASLVVSGIYLMFFYVPSPTSAYGDIQVLQTQVGFGQFMRNVHRWSAHLMVVAVMAHMARVFYRGAYKPPRQFNWVIGVVLLGLTLLLSFTGYLLPWDQLAYWAITVGTSLASFVPLIGDAVSRLLLGGPQVSSSTLLRFYVLHVALLPTLVVLIIAVHLWRWRKDSTFDAEGSPESERPPTVDGHRVLGVVPGRPAAGTTKDPHGQQLVMTWPHLTVRHAVVALVVLLVVLLVSLAFNAPLRDIANPAVTPNPEKAPWYFIGLQELLSRFDPLIAGVLVPAFITIGLVALPYIDRNPARRIRERKVAVWTFSLFLVAWIVLTLIGFAFRGPDWDWLWPWRDGWYAEL